MSGSSIKSQLKRLLRGKTAASADAAESPPTASPPDWEYAPSGWKAIDPARSGWNVASVASTQASKWPDFLDSVAGPGPLGVSHEAAAGSGRENTWAHNLVMSYGYVLALAARQKARLSILDWGGGVGHYYPISRSLLPDLVLDYYCQDVPLLTVAGRSLQPNVRFFDGDDECFEGRYDLVVAGSSLWYAEDWKSQAAKLAASTLDYLYITRMIFVRTANSYVAIQRPTQYGYLTEYQFWVLNQRELLDHVESLGMSLIREFVFGESPLIPGAPERGVFRGFLFRRDFASQ